MTIPEGCLKLGYLWCCQLDEDLKDPSHIIGVTYTPLAPFDVDGITYAGAGHTFRAMFELIDPR